MDTIANIFKHFAEIDEEYLLSEMHCHTTWTDGSSSVEDIATKAEFMGLKRLFFTDHVRRASTYFPEYASEIRKLSEGKDIKLFVGYESKIADFEGHLDISQECRETADIILGTVHSFPSDYGFIHPSELESSEVIETEYKLLLACYLGPKSLQNLSDPGSS